MMRGMIILRDGQVVVSREYKESEEKEVHQWLKRMKEIYPDHVPVGEHIERNTVGKKP